MVAKGSYASFSFYNALDNSKNKNKVRSHIGRNEVLSKIAWKLLWKSGPTRSYRL